MAAGPARALRPVPVARRSPPPTSGHAVRGGRHVLDVVLRLALSPGRLALLPPRHRPRDSCPRPRPSPSAPRSARASCPATGRALPLLVGVLMSAAGLEWLSRAGPTGSYWGSVFGGADPRHLRHGARHHPARLRRHRRRGPHPGRPGLGGAQHQPPGRRVGRPGRPGHHRRGPHPVVLRRRTARRAASRPCTRRRPDRRVLPGLHRGGADRPGRGGGRVVHPAPGSPPGARRVGPEAAVVDGRRRPWRSTPRGSGQSNWCQLATDGWVDEAGPAPKSEKTFSIIRHSTGVTPGIGGNTMLGSMRGAFGQPAHEHRRPGGEHAPTPGGGVVGHVRDPSPDRGWPRVSGPGSHVRRGPPVPARSGRTRPGRRGAGAGRSATPVPAKIHDPASATTMSGVGVDIRVLRSHQLLLGSGHRAVGPVGGHLGRVHAPQGVLLGEVGLVAHLVPVWPERRGLEADVAVDGVGAQERQVHARPPRPRRRRRAWRSTSIRRAPG